MNNHYKPEIKSLFLIHTILLAGQIIAFLLVYFLAGKQGNEANLQLFKTLQILVAITAIASVSLAFSIFKNKVAQLQISESGLPQKLVSYREACILKYALIEGPILLSIIAYFIFPNASFIVFALVLIVLFAMQRPTIPMLVHDISVNREDFFE